MFHSSFSSHVDTFLQAWATSNNFNFQILLFAHVTKLRIVRVQERWACTRCPKCNRAWEQSQIVVNIFLQLLWSCVKLNWMVNSDQPFLPHLNFILHNLSFTYMSSSYSKFFLLWMKKHGIFVQFCKTYNFEIYSKLKGLCFL